MATLLRIDSSINPDSVSRRLTGDFSGAWRDAGGTVVERDVNGLPHLGDFNLHFAGRTGVAKDDPAAALQDELIAEVESADAIVVGAPMYNYSLPSPLKAWLDYLHVGGRTGLDAAGNGPFRGTRAVIVSTRGAAYDDRAFEAARDHVLPVFRALFGDVMGMDVQTVTVDRTLAGLMPELGAAEAARQVEAARAALVKTAARLAAGA